MGETHVTMHVIGGFDLRGLDAARFSNHDLVKERVTLHWYAALD